MKVFKIPNNVQGAVLPTVLFLLLIITLLAVSSMSDSIIQQKSATNVYLENEAFHVAESAVSATIYDELVAGNLLHGTNLEDDITVSQRYCVGAKGQLIKVNATNTDGDLACTGLTYESVDELFASSEVEFLNQGCDCPGFELGSSQAGGIGCNGWKITGSATIAEQTSVDVESWVIKVGGCFSTDDDLGLALEP